MTPQQQKYNDLLCQIQTTLRSIQPSLGPMAGLAMVEEIVRTLNRVQADMMEALHHHGQRATAQTSDTSQDHYYQSS